MAKKISKAKPAIGTRKFKRAEHVYELPDEFDELIKDAIRFFNGAPVYSYPLPKFAGPGVYAIYAIARTGIYEHFGTVNRTDYRMPIYVAKPSLPVGEKEGNRHRILGRLAIASTNIAKASRHANDWTSTISTVDSSLWKTRPVTSYPPSKLH